ncbi:4'-phosphopantetheinyl transferase superfamily protein [Streptomyces sp. NPDC000594]|uniref:4'-phosphopantetheinyl transferase family protein n=1 Tax=Streptomyces sp. NPDC000594 TaxID=3154261 RepID=UPI0033185849
MPLPGSDEAHVWSVDLDLPAEGLRALRELLGPDERERARRCVLPLQRDRFTAARGALRSVLARYTGTAPERLRFLTSPRGRPRLATPVGRLGGAERLKDPEGPEGLEGLESSAGLERSEGLTGAEGLEDLEGLDFSLSHSGATALIAVAHRTRVGVDIEEIDPALDHRTMARRFLGPAEAELAAALPDPAGRRVFFTGWTRREAFAKAADCPIPRTLRLGDARLLWDLHIRPGTCAALVTTRPVSALRSWTWEGPVERTPHAHPHGR